MKAEILAVGTELLLGDILNTNAQFLAQELANLGIEVYYQTVVGDNPQRLKDTIFHAFSRADLIITTGGLGPTEDDLTKETAAEYFGERLILDERALGRIRKYFDRTGRVMTENNCEAGNGAGENGIVLYNDNGTAPGIIMEKNWKDDCDAARPSERNDSHVPKSGEALSGEEAGIYLCFPYSARGRGGRECHGGKGKGYH